MFLLLQPLSRIPPSMHAKSHLLRRRMLLCGNFSLFSIHPEMHHQLDICMEIQYCFTSHSWKFLFPPFWINGIFIVSATESVQHAQKLFLCSCVYNKTMNEINDAFITLLPPLMRHQKLKLQLMANFLLFAVFSSRFKKKIVVILPVLEALLTEITELEICCTTTIDGAKQGWMRCERFAKKKGKNCRKILIDLINYYESWKNAINEIRQRRFNNLKGV